MLNLKKNFFNVIFENKFLLLMLIIAYLFFCYKFDFSNYKGESIYKRDTNAFRYNENPIDVNDIDIIFTGGSTTNQKFLNFQDTIVGNLDNYFNEKNFVNAGVDGLSIRGHINSFNFWFNNINDLKSKFYIFYLGINDQNLLRYKKKSVDEFQESDFEGNIREYLESNSFFYKKFRLLKANLYLKYNIQKGANIVNKDNVVYGERSKKKFITYEELSKSFDKYILLLNTLTNKVEKLNAKPIYITQISGYGMNSELFSAANAIMDHCKNKNLQCINLAKDINLDYEDFYDSLHLTPKGSLKVSSYLSKKLEKIIN